MTRVSRYDIGRFDKTERTPEGYLVAPMRAAKVGILKYYDASGNPFKEFVPEDELFNSDSMRTLALKPVTVKDHPKVFLDAKNYKVFQVGLTGENIVKDGNFLSANAVIQDGDAIDMIDNGMQEISCGYTAELDMTPGEFNGEKYDAVQRNRRYNHVTVLDRGRAGREARLRLDSELNIVKEDNTMKFKISDKEFEIPQEVADHISGLMSANAALTTGKADAEAKLSASKADAEKLPAVSKELETAKGRADAAENKIKELENPAKFNERVKVRVDLIGIAKPMTGEEDAAKFDSMDDLAIMKAVILADSKDFKFDGKSDEYVKAYFDVLVSRRENRESEDGGFGKEVVGARKDAAGCAGEEMGGKNMNGGKVALKDKWKQPLSE